MGVCTGHLYIVKSVNSGDYFVGTKKCSAKDAMKVFEERFGKDSEITCVMHMKNMIFESNESED